MGALGAIGVVGDEGFLGQNVQASEPTQSFVEVEVIDVTVAFLVEKFQDEEAEQGADRRNHSGARIASVLDESVEAKLGQQRQKEKSPGKAGADTALRRLGQCAAVGNGRDLGTRR